MLYDYVSSVVIALLPLVVWLGFKRTRPLWAPLFGLNVNEPETATRLVRLVERATGTSLPLRIRAWDGSEAGPSDAPLIVVRNRRALLRVLYSMDTLGLFRGYVAGDIGFDGDMIDIGRRLISLDFVKKTAKVNLFQLLTCVHLLPEAIALAGWGLPPPAPPEEVKKRSSLLHSLDRDRESIGHHYDVGNKFYELLLGESMVYSCGYFLTPESLLVDAQRAKLEIICRKLSLEPGQRFLDVGCGWGSMVIYAAQRYGVTAVGVTISAEQAAYGRLRVVQAGLVGKVDIRIQDYREIPDGPYDAISSVGMGEHVGASKYSLYAKALFGLLKPGGRLLNHQISCHPELGLYRMDPFVDAFVFPDAQLAPIGTTVSLLEDAGFEVRDVHSIREHYVLTALRWIDNLKTNWDQVVSVTSEGRARVWLAFLSNGIVSFEKCIFGVNQVLAVRRESDGSSRLPLTREEWLWKSPIGTVGLNLNT